MEERQYRLWIQDLKIPGVVITDDFYADVHDGVLLNQVLDAIRPGSVNWKQIRNPHILGKIHESERIANHQLFVENANTQKLNMRGIDKIFLSKGDKKAILSSFF